MRDIGKLGGIMDAKDVIINRKDWNLSHRADRGS